METKARLTRPTIVAVLSLWTSGSLASVTEQAPPSFTAAGQQVVPVDITQVKIKYKYDYSARAVYATANVSFVADQAGYPLIDLVASPTSVLLNSQSISPNVYREMVDPDRTTRFRVLREFVAAGSTNEMVVEYQLPDTNLNFGNGRVRSAFFTTDLSASGRKFFEQYGPANYEFDQIKYLFEVEVVNVSREHEIFTNGDVLELGDNHWEVEFPEYFNASMIYFHLTEANRFYTREFSFDSLSGATIPVTIYSTSRSLADTAAGVARSVLRENEANYGPLLHPKVVAYLTSGNSGMEYGGATITGLGALEHEFTHFWFARGVMPANGNAGWIDEAIASWRDNGYPRARSAPSRNPVNLGGFSPYRRHTTMDAYSLGARLMSEFDYLLRGSGGLKPVLAELFSQKKMTTITVASFKNFLVDQTGLDLDAIFNRYVYGRSHWQPLAPLSSLKRYDPLPRSRHPYPPTPQELKRLL